MLLIADHPSAADYLSSSSRFLLLQQFIFVIAITHIYRENVICPEINSLFTSVPVFVRNSGHDLVL